MVESLAQGVIQEVYIKCAFLGRIHFEILFNEKISHNMCMTYAFTN